ncbi:MAG: DUF2946 family protein [Steroidobacteraceae bacterium]
MNYRGSHRWATVAVLGVLFLRGLVPVGFMLAPIDGSLAFVLCDFEMPAGEHRHHHHHDQAAHLQGTHSDPSCPYAQSAGPAPLPTLPVLAGGTVFDLLVPAAVVTQTFARFGPARHQTSRGPPLPV